MREKYIYNYHFHNKKRTLITAMTQKNIHINARKNIILITLIARKKNMILITITKNSYSHLQQYKKGFTLM